jgi:hypothetical protein
VRHLVGELDHPDPGAKLKELDPSKGLGEQIRKLVLDIDVAHFEVSFLQAASNEVVPHPDVLAPFMKNGVLCQGQSGFAVHLSSTAPVSLSRRSPSNRTSQSD